MTRIESSILVLKSREEVFAFLSECESHRRFIPRMVALRQTSPGDFGQAGTTLSGMLRYFGLPIPVRYEIVEVEPGRRLAMNGQMGPIGFRDGYVLTPASGGTEITFWLELMAAGWAKLFRPFMGLVGKVHAWETLRNLKRALAGPRAASSSRSLQ